MSLSCESIVPRESADQLRAAELRLSLSSELLASEWLAEGKNDEERAYLMSTLLPTLILGIEKLLTEVSERELEETEEMQYDFNPINLLAQYLMRNNPHHIQLPSSHPYCQKLNQVVQDLEIKRSFTATQENDDEGGDQSESITQRT